MLDMDFKWGWVQTLENIEKYAKRATEEALGEVIGETIIKDIANSGVNILTLQIQCNNSVFLKGLHMDIANRWKAINKEPKHYVPKEFWQDFFADLYSYEYAAEIAKESYIQEKKGFIQNLKDIQSAYYNVKEGNRVTTSQPYEYKKTIYFFGSCIIVGSYCEDQNTIESYLQRLLNNNGYCIKVVNCGCWSNEMYLFMRMLATNFKKGDIAIIYDSSKYGGKSFTGIPNLDLGLVLEENKVPAKWFLDSAIHANHKVNEMFAKEIFNDLQAKYLLINSADVDAKLPKMPIKLLAKSYIDSYFNCEIYKNKTVGSIVMNCNPYTNGHRYLIEEARGRVDKLIIFVVEEDESLFSFKERYAMVVDGTKDLSGVEVVPSGDVILSQQTFPEYFVKIEDDDTSRNAEFDIKIFAEAIAPSLNIKYRFVGEEKADHVTAEYNSAMRRILGRYDIELVEIQRKSGFDGEPISATKVRELLSCGEFDRVKDYVPKTSWDIIMKRWD